MHNTLEFVFQITILEKFFFRISTILVVSTFLGSAGNGLTAHRWIQHCWHTTASLVWMEIVWYGTRQTFWLKTNATVPYGFCVKLLWQWISLNKDIHIHAFWRNDLNLRLKWWAFWLKYCVCLQHWFLTHFYSFREKLGGGLLFLLGEIGGGGVFPVLPKYGPMFQRNNHFFMHVLFLC